MNGSFYVIKGFKIIFKKGFKRYVLIPTLLNFVLISALMGFSVYGLHGTLQTLEMPWPEWLSWLAFMLPILKALFWILVVVLMLVFFGSLSSFVIPVISAPFNSLLCEKILEKEYHYELPKMTMWQIAHQAWRRELGKLLYILPRYLGMGMIALLAFFIPAVNLLFSTIFFLVAAWLTSFEYLDYSAEAFNIPLKDYKKHLSLHKLNVESFGLGALLVFSIPVVNFVCMPAIVAGATALWAEQCNQA